VEEAASGATAAAQELREAAAAAGPSPREAGPLTEVVDLGAEILRDYLRFNKDGEGQVELPQFVALVESTLLRRGLKVFRKQLEGMFTAADFDEDGVLDLRAFCQMASVTKYFETLQRREIAAQRAIKDAAAQAEAQQQAAAAHAAAQQQAQAAFQPQMMRPGAAAAAAAGVPSLALGNADASAMPMYGEAAAMAHFAAAGHGGGEYPLLSQRAQQQRDLQLAMQMGGRNLAAGGFRPPSARPGADNGAGVGPNPSLRKRPSVIYLDDWMKGGSGLSTKGAQREVAAQQQQLQLNLNTAAAAGSPSARGGSPSARAGGGGAAAGRTDLAAMMAGAEVSARRQSIVKRDGTVDAATLAANERLSKMVAMQAGALGSATDGRATGTVDGGMIGKLVDWRLGVGSTPSGRGGIASGRGGMASGRAPQQPPAAPANPYAVGAGAGATAASVNASSTTLGAMGELGKLALAGVGSRLGGGGADGSARGTGRMLKKTESWGRRLGMGSKRGGGGGAAASSSAAGAGPSATAGPGPSAAAAVPSDRSGGGSGRRNLSRVDSFGRAARRMSGMFSGGKRSLPESGAPPVLGSNRGREKARV